MNNDWYEIIIREFSNNLINITIKKNKKTMISISSNNLNIIIDEIGKNYNAYKEIYGNQHRDTRIIAKAFNSFKGYVGIWGKIKLD